MFSDSPKIVELNCFSWMGKNSQGMYDYSLPYQSPQIVKSLIKTSLKSILIMRHKSNQNILLQTQIKTKIEFIKDEYVVKNARKQTKDENQNFMFIKSPNSYENNSQLKKGSIIKLGKTKLEVTFLKVDKQSYTRRRTFYEQNFKKIQYKVENSDILENFYVQKTGNSADDELPQCKYCFSDEFTELNPLINVCQCDGYSKFVHLDCISEWVLKKSKYRQNNQKGIFFAQKYGLKCQICDGDYEIQKFLPCFIRKKLISYIILQCCQEKQTNKTLFIIDLDKNKQISLGRSTQCDIFFDDLSISRKHCSLLFDNYTGDIFILDNNSKYGTLLKYSAIKIQNNLQIQKGRTMISFRVRQNKNRFYRLRNFFC